MLVRKFSLVLLSGVIALGAATVDAKRVGGGKSTGAKRDVATQRQSTPPAAANTATPASPAAPASAAAATKAPAAAAVPAAAAAAPKTGFARFLPMLGGLAIGAALASMFGGGALGSFIANALMFLAVAMVGLFIWRMIAARRAGNAGGLAPALAGAGGAAAGAAAAGGMQRASSEPVQFGGNRSATVPVEVATPVATEVLAPEAAGIAAQVPAGFDVPGFEKGAKGQFIRLQAAFDKGESATLKDMLTDEMFAEVSREVKERGAQVQPTEIVTLNAETIEVTSETDAHWASVRFHGLIREDGKDQAEAFDEVWNLTKPTDGSAGWLLAGIQQLG